MKDNTGDVPLPGKPHGEGKMERAHYGEPKRGAGKQGTNRTGSQSAPSGDVKDPMGSWSQGTSGKGEKANRVPETGH